VSQSAETCVDLKGFPHFDDFTSAVLSALKSIEHEANKRAKKTSAAQLNARKLYNNNKHESALQGLFVSFLFRL
jgi:hypothetical protein